MRLKVTLILIVLHVFTACDRPKCTNTNPIFDNNLPESSIYKLELEKQLQVIGSENLRYWLKAYVENGNEDYLLVNVQNDDLCAIMQLKVIDWNKLEDIRKKKGIGRRGAELDGLIFTIQKKENAVDFLYDTLTWIID